MINDTIPISVDPKTLPLCLINKVAFVHVKLGMRRFHIKPQKAIHKEASDGKINSAKISTILIGNFKIVKITPMPNPIIDTKICAMILDEKIAFSLTGLDLRIHNPFPSKDIETALI